MKYDILHRTRYHYATPVRDSFNDVRLQPMPIATQTVESFLLKVLPAARLTHFKDFCSNWVNHFEISEPHSDLLIEAQSRIVTHPTPPLPEAPLCPLAALQEAPNVDPSFDYLQSSRFVEITPEAWKLAVDATVGIDDTWLASLALLRFVHGHLEYVARSTHVHTHMAEVLQDRKGVCQDFAHLFIGLCRSLKIPARYVSGYLATETASATHAWTEIFLPGHGWCALDPTNDCQCGETYIKIANGRDYADVPPVTGTYRGTRDHKMEVEVRVSLI